ncbi:hypothetical protein GCM10009827_116750 [Dactylosporangium maewongense]|uniref:Uncharacterized protein n=1 Tax=Dactylosporangium maewongense TaxID=634393 RepID=A0ABP4P889_9ACTN
MRLYHPDWCARTACTAYGVEGDRDQTFELWHRSEPLVIQTDNPRVSLFIHRFAEVDGSGECLELAMLEIASAKPWYLTDSVANRELVLPRESADAMFLAMAALV